MRLTTGSKRSAGTGMHRFKEEGLLQHDGYAGSLTRNIGM